MTFSRTAAATHLGGKCDPALYGLTARPAREKVKLHNGCDGVWEDRHGTAPWVCSCPCHADGGISNRVLTSVPIAL